MKYAFMSFSTPNSTLSEMITLANTYGYDGIEPRLDSKHAHGLDISMSRTERAEAKKQIDDSPIDLACLATSQKFADPAASQTVITRTRDIIDLAGDLGAPTIRVFGGKLAEGLSRTDAVKLLIDSFGSLTEQAADREVIMCMETHDDWCNPEDVAAVMEGINHPNVAVNWDIMHPVRKGYATVKASFETLRPWIKHVHMHDGVGTDIKFTPIGDGDIDHKTAVSCLLSAGYSGYLSGEWINWSAAEEHLPREIATMKQYEKES